MRTPPIRIKLAIVHHHHHHKSSNHNNLKFGSVVLKITEIQGDQHMICMKKS